MKIRVRRFIDGCSGAAGVGVLLLFAVLLTAMLFVCEFFYAFNLKQNVDIELTRAVNTAVDLAMSDEHRKDKLLELEPDVAYSCFYEYLRDDMHLTPGLELCKPGGTPIYVMEIVNLDIRQSPPAIRVNAVISVKPLFTGQIVSAQIRLNVRGSSVNRRID